MHLEQSHRSYLFRDVPHYEYSKLRLDKTDMLADLTPSFLPCLESHGPPIFVDNMSKHMKHLYGQVLEHVCYIARSTEGS